MALDPVEFLESDCFQIAFSTMRTGNHRYSLDHEQVAGAAITSRNTTLPGSPLYRKSRRSDNSELAVAFE